MAVNEKASLKAQEELRKKIDENSVQLDELRKLSYIDSYHPRMKAPKRDKFKSEVKVTLSKLGVSEKELTSILKSRAAITAAINTAFSKQRAIRYSLFRDLNVLEVTLDIKKATYIRNTLLVKIQAIEKSTDSHDVLITFKSAARAIKRYNYVPLNFTPTAGFIPKRTFKTYKGKLIAAMTSYVKDLEVELKDLNITHEDLLNEKH